MSLKRLVITLVITLELSIAGVAQIQIGTVQGDISDETHAALDNVNLTLDNPVTGYHQNTVSSAEGHFVFNNVPFNVYTLRGERSGFHEFARAIHVRSNVPIQVDIQLKIKPLAESIIVVPTPELVEKDSSTTHLTVDESFIERQPGATPSRGLQPLISTMPGWTTEDNGLLNIRGTDDEILYVVDGIPIIERLDPRFSTPMNQEMIRSMDVITGNVPAEYGHRLGAVVALQPKSGIDTPLFSSVQFSGGNLNAGEISLQTGGKVGEKVGFYLASAASQSHRYLDPPDARNFNNLGGAGQLNLRFDWHPTQADILLFHFWNGGSNFRVANDDEQQRTGNRQRVKLRNDSQSVSWQHVWSSETVTNLALYRRSFASRLVSNARTNPFQADQDRRHGRQGLIGSLSHQRHGHTMKFGVETIRTTPREFFSYAVTDDDDAEDLGFTVLARSFVPGRPFVFRDRKTFGHVAWYMQDTFSPFSNFTVSGGLRYDYSHQLVSSQLLSPRIGAVYYISKTRTAVRGSFNRLFQPPPVENLLVSASEQARQLSPLAPQGSGYTPIRPETVSAYEVGFAQDVFSFFKLDVAYFWRDFRNFDDPNVFFATTIIFPNSVARGHAQGLDVRVDVPERRGFSGYFNFTNQNTYQIGPINGGLFLTTDLLRFGPGVRFIPDQDQRNSGSFGVTYRHHRSGLWTSFSGHHESGGPTEIEENEIRRVSRRLRRQGVDPARVVNFGRQRVRPRTLFNFSTGIDLFRKERVSVSTQFDIQNVSNRLFAYNVGNPFSGTHFGHPRLYSGRLKFTFR